MSRTETLAYITVASKGIHSWSLTFRLDPYLVHTHRHMNPCYGRIICHYLLNLQKKSYKVNIQKKPFWKNCSTWCFFCLTILQNKIWNFCEVLALTVIRRSSQRVKYKHSNKREEVIDIATLHPAITSSCAYQIFRTEQSDQENTSHN